MDDRYESISNSPNAENMANMQHAQVSTQVNNLDSNERKSPLHQPIHPRNAIKLKRVLYLQHFSVAKNINIKRSIKSK